VARNNQSISNEQAVIEAEAKLSELKNSYVSCLRPLAISVPQGVSPTLEQLIDYQVKSSEYFNYAESFVGRSGLLGAHANGKWVTGFAESCFSLLDLYIYHVNFLRSHCDVLGVSTIEPSKHAYANMQRMVKEYLPEKDSTDLMKRFQENDLPTTGFVMAASENENKIPTWQILTSSFIGCGGLICVVLLAVMLPNPTRWQEFVFRGALAVALAAIIPIIPGFINLKARVKGWGNYLSIMAGGAIAIFVLIWLVNPPQTDQPSQQESKVQESNDKSSNIKVEK
jgi:hypothetical protein